MQLFPTMSVKNFSECTHAEIISYVNRNEVLAGICIQDASGKREFLILDSNDSDQMFYVANLRSSDEVLSYGTVWTLSPYGQIVDRNVSRNTAGAILITSEGEYIVANSQHGIVYCRLDDKDVVSGTATPGGGVAFEYWRIHYFDEAINSRQKLLAKDRPETDMG